MNVSGNRINALSASPTLSNDVDSEKILHSHEPIIHSLAQCSINNSDKTDPQQLSGSETTLSGHSDHELLQFTPSVRKARVLIGEESSESNNGDFDILCAASCSLFDSDSK